MEAPYKGKDGKWYWINRWGVKSDPYDTRSEAREDYNDHKSEQRDGTSYVIKHNTKLY